MLDQNSRPAAINKSSKPTLSLKDIQDNIKLAYDYSRNNHKYFKATKKFVYDVSLTSNDQQNLQSQEKNQLTFNVLTPILDNNLRNIRDGYPEATIVAKSDDPAKIQQADRLNQKLGEIYEDSNYEHATYSVAENAMAGNEGIYKIKTQYLDDLTFDQVHVITSVDDPTTILFDPYAKEITKSDAEFVVELTYMSKEAFQRKWPNVETKNVQKSTDMFPWIEMQMDSKKEIYTVATYWHKQVTNYELFQLENGSVTDKLPKDQKAVATRTVERSRVYTIRIFGDQILEEFKTTVFTRPPFVDVPGKIVKADTDIKLLAYLHNAIDAQRAKNFMAEEFIDRALNAWNSMCLVAEESLSGDTLTDLQDPTKKRIIKYKAYFTPEGSTDMVQLPPPEIRPPEPLSPDLLNFFTALDDTIQKILAGYSMSLDQQDLSGKALYNMSSYINASNEPFMHHLELAAVDIAQIILDSMPELNSSEQFEQELPNGQKVLVMENYEFHPQEFIVKSLRNVNTRLQKEATIERLGDLAQQAPPFAQFLFGPGLPMLLEMMDLKDKDEWIKAFAIYQKQLQNQPPQPNPQVIQAQAKMLDAQNDTKRIALDQQKLAVDVQHNNLQAATDIHQQAAETKRTEINAAVDLHKTHKDGLKHVLSTLHPTVTGASHASTR